MQFRVLLLRRVFAYIVKYVLCHKLKIFSTTNFLSNSVKYKNKSKIHVYFSLCMEFKINSTVKDNNLVGVKL